MVTHAVSILLYPCTILVLFCVGQPSYLLFGQYVYACIKKKKELPPAVLYLEIVHIEEGTHCFGKDKPSRAPPCTQNTHEGRAQVCVCVGIEPTTVQRELCMVKDDPFVEARSHASLH